MVEEQEELELEVAAAAEVEEEEEAAAAVAEAAVVARGEVGVEAHQAGHPQPLVTLVARPE